MNRPGVEHGNWMFRLAPGALTPGIADRLRALTRDLRPPEGAQRETASDLAARAGRRRSAPNPLWYKDAIIYELRVRSFFDSNGDGIGDFRGLAPKLDYLQDLGVTALWLLPFYPSPLRDDGYDIADYTDVHPELRHARRLRAVPRRGAPRAACASSPSWCSTTPPTSTRGSSARAARPPDRSSATSTSGATRPSATARRASSSRTSSRRTGPGIRSRAPTTGIASTRTSPI